MEKIYSLGIDIGTTTTQMIICQLVIEHTVANYTSEAPQILERHVLYKSPVKITPMMDAKHLDEEVLIEYILDFIHASGIEPSCITTGAVIITGESSLKENAHKLIDLVASLTGKFVVTSAGADLESYLAGAGSGAKELSKTQKVSITNIDVGGGTTNCMQFIEGEPNETLTLHLGGRLIRVDQMMRVMYISPVYKQLDSFQKLGIREGETLEKQSLARLTEWMGGMLLRAIGEKGECKTPLEESLYVSQSKGSSQSEYYTISGGVGTYVYETVEDDKKLYDLCRQYGDIGPFLGQALRKKFEAFGLKLLQPKQTLRATVCGVGAHSMRLSGNTIYLEKEILPIKDLPLIKSTYTGDPVSWCQEVIKRKSYYEEDCAIYIDYQEEVTYGQIKILAHAIIDEIQLLMKQLVLVVCQNIGKALGQTIACQKEKAKPLICIDHVKVASESYIDIGEPVGEAVPVVIKTLIF